MQQIDHIIHIIITAGWASCLYHCHHCQVARDAVIITIIVIVIEAAVGASVEPRRNGL
jgi:hypothetical protein